MCSQVIEGVDHKNKHGIAVRASSQRELHKCRQHSSERKSSEFDEDFKVYWRSETKCTIEKRNPDVSLGSGWVLGRSDPMGGLGWGRSDTWGMGGRSYQPPTDQFMATYMLL